MAMKGGKIRIFGMIWQYSFLVAHRTRKVRCFSNAQWEISCMKRETPLASQRVSVTRQMRTSDILRGMLPQGDDTLATLHEVNHDKGVFPTVLSGDFA
ncbi:hypothetical protein D1872_321010 [compost metagenome]